MHLLKPSDLVRSSRLWLVATLLFSLPTPLTSAADLSYYLPNDVDYDPGLPTPAAALQANVGEWHVRHDQLVYYFRSLAELSPRMVIHEYGRTHENRSLFLAVVSSPENLENLEQIRQDHLARLTADGPTKADAPVITWMGYGVHGDEPSGTNASLLLAYHLTAGRGKEIDRLLQNSVILIDPCVNPDGTSRFAQWANSHRGVELVADPDHREHRQGWPSGRTNHYWFDLNRDWLLLTHPESRGRLEQFHRWKPNLLTDFHEMGTSSTYFFQPGIPSRQNPLTPAGNLELTRNIARFHAQTLDEIGSLYYTEESFDDFYYGKGSTYPDANGCIGILFEQASSRGHIQESPAGLLSFPFTIRNQFRTSLSSMDAAVTLREELLAYQREFYRSSRQEAAKDPVRAYLFGTAGDPSRCREFVDILLRHQIVVHRLRSNVGQAGRVFDASSSYIVPLDQPQYRLARALFERRTEFADPTFYDVSTWTLPLSFGLPSAELGSDEFNQLLLGARVLQPDAVVGQLERTSDPYAFLFEWKGYFSPRALNRLLQAGVRARVATRPFEAATLNGPRSFDYGTILVPMGIQDVPAEEIMEHLKAIAAQDGINVHAVTTGLTEVGIDLGSPSLAPLDAPHPLLLIGTGVRAYEAGEVWHLLDQRYGMKVTLGEMSRFGSFDLERYTHVILVSGSYSSLKDHREDLRRWIRKGGVLLSTRSSVPWVERNILARSETKNEADDEVDPGAPKPTYADYEEDRAKNLVSGAIFEAEIDRTHPLGFGYAGPRIAVFRNHTTIMELEENLIASVVRYTEAPLLSGFASAENIERIRKTAVVSATRLGQGTVIRYVDNPNFRGVWYGTNKLFANGLFFGSIIRRTSSTD